MALSQHSEIVLHHDGPQPPELNCLTLAPWVNQGKRLVIPLR